MDFSYKNVNYRLCREYDDAFYIYIVINDEFKELVIKVLTKSYLSLMVKKIKCFIIKIVKRRMSMDVI